MARLHMTPAETRYLRRIVADDHQVVVEALRRLSTGQHPGIVLPYADALLQAQSDLAASVLEKIDMAL